MRQRDKKTSQQGHSVLARRRRSRPESIKAMHIRAAQVNSARKGVVVSGTHASKIRIQPEVDKAATWAIRHYRKALKELEKY